MLHAHMYCIILVERQGGKGQAGPGTLQPVEDYRTFEPRLLFGFL